MAEGAKLVQQDVNGLLDRPLQEISSKVQWPCRKCSPVLLPNLRDNARVPCRLEVRDDIIIGSLVNLDFTSITSRQIFRHNRPDFGDIGVERDTGATDAAASNETPATTVEENSSNTTRRLIAWNGAGGDSSGNLELDPLPWFLHVKCRRCDMLVASIQPTDTPEKLHKDLREYITNDKSLPLMFDRLQTQPDFPDSAARACMLANEFPAEQKITNEFISHVETSLQQGALQRRLQQKMDAKSSSDESLRRLTYLRVGVGMRALGPITAVLELWPAGHSSPKHQHGGCAGSVRVLHGVLDVKLYENLFEEQPIKWQNGDGGLELPPGSHETLKLAAGDTTGMDRANWFVHEVACNPLHDANRHGFAMSLHVYISCTDEFYMLSAAADGADNRAGEAKRGNPPNDFFWNLDLPAEDKRVQEAKAGEVLDFLEALAEEKAMAREQVLLPQEEHEQEMLEEAASSSMLTGQPQEGPEEEVDELPDGLVAVELDGANDVDTSRFEPVIQQLILSQDLDIDELGNIIKISLEASTFCGFFANVPFFVRKDIDSLLLAIARYSRSRRSLVMPGGASTGCCQELQQLSLAIFPDLTDQGLRWLLGSQGGSGCPKLQVLVLWGCGQVTDGALRQLAGAQGCLQLRNLNLGLCTQVTDEGLRLLAAALGGNNYSEGGCKHLQRLNLCGCSRITDRGLRWLAGSQGCRDLQAFGINMYCCPLITEAGERALREGVAA